MPTFNLSALGSEQRASVRKCDALVAAVEAHGLSVQGRGEADADRAISQRALRTHHSAGGTDPLFSFID